MFKEIKQESVFVRYIGKEGEVTTTFVDIVDLQSGNAEGMKTANILVPLLIITHFMRLEPFCIRLYINAYYYYT